LFGYQEKPIHANEFIIAKPGHCRQALVAFQDNALVVDGDTAK
jgi:hypothetical protein